MQCNASPLISGNVSDRIDQERFQLSIVSNVFNYCMCMPMEAVHSNLLVCRGLTLNPTLNNKNVGQAISGDETPSAGLLGIAS